MTSALFRSRLYLDQLNIRELVPRGFLKAVADLNGPPFSLTFIIPRTTSKLSQSLANSKASSIQVVEG